MSSILTILNEPWAIQLDKKREMDDIYTRHLKGDKIDLKGLEARLGRPLGNTRSFEVVNGDAMIPVEGIVSKRISLFHDISGGVSTDKLAEQISQAVSDPTVDRIILLVDSPGGAVDGTKAVADMIYAARGSKPIIAWVDGLAASAAYWIASAADEVYLRDATTFAGSIGVVATHVDKSQQEAQNGVKTTEVTAGKFKRIDSGYAPLTEEGQQSIQDRVDKIYSVFLADVGRNRGDISAEQVHNQMADGRLFMGQDAVNAGLADGISSLDSIVLNKKPKKPTPTKKGMTMDINTLKAEHPDLVTALKAEATTEAEAAFKEKEIALKAEGATAERARISGVLDAALPGYEDMAKTFAFDGKTTPGDALIAMSAEEKKRRAGEANGAREDAPAPLKTGGKGDTTADEGTDLKARWNATPTVRAFYNNDFAKFEKAEALRASMQATGQIRAFNPGITPTHK